MKSPITGKEMTLITEKRVMKFRKEDFEYVHQSYFCKDSGEFFTTTELDELNITQVYNQYRDKHNIPFPDQIVDLKNRYNLSSNKMSAIFGLGANSYRNYEKGEVPSLANGKLIGTAIDDIRTFRKLVENNNDLPVSDKEKVLHEIENVSSKYKKNLVDRSFISYLFPSKLPDNYTGYRSPNMDKISNVILFFSEKIQPTETMINKLMFYADFVNYRKLGYSITGLRYKANLYGPVPNNYGTIFDYVHNKDIINIKSEQFQHYWGKVFYKNKVDFNQDIFSKEEIESLKLVFDKFKHSNATEIKDISHEEDAWLDNHESKDLIDYSYAFTLKTI